MQLQGYVSASLSIITHPKEVPSHCPCYVTLLVYSFVEEKREEIISHFPYQMMSLLVLAPIQPTKLPSLIDPLVCIHPSGEPCCHHSPSSATVPH